jgi:hypothetical protein
MTATWSPDELERIGSATESEIAVKRADGTVRRWVPIWVVSVGELDAAYRMKYGSHGSSSVEAMVTEAAAVATLQLSRE